MRHRRLITVLTVLAATVVLHAPLAQGASAPAPGTSVAAFLNHGDQWLRQHYKGKVVEVHGIFDYFHSSLEPSGFTTARDFTVALESLSDYRSQFGALQDVICDFETRSPHDVETLQRGKRASQLVTGQPVVVKGVYTPGMMDDVYILKQCKFKVLGKKPLPKGH